MLLTAEFEIVRAGDTIGHGNFVDQNATRKVIHVDMDAFYASVEQRDDPALKGRPVAVGGSRARGVVAAASYEARAFGVRSAMPSVTALRQCPELVFVKPRFDVYKDVSRQIRSIFLEYTPLVEPLSLDEAYLDVTESLKSIATATAIAITRELRQRIFATTSLTASAGVSYNKFLVKLASDYRKPNGLYVIPPECGAAFVEPLPIERFHGIGPKTAEKMTRLGIYTGLDLRQQTEMFLQKHFGKAGSYYFGMARGIDQRAVVPDRVRKSVGSETTFATDITAPAEATEALKEPIDSVWQHCERVRIFGRTVTVKAKYADFTLVTRVRTLATPLEGKDALERAAMGLLGSLFPLEKGVRLLGVSVSNFVSDAMDEEAATPQLTLAL